MSLPVIVIMAWLGLNVAVVIVLAYFAHRREHSKSIVHHYGRTRVGFADDLNSGVDARHEVDWDQEPSFDLDPYEYGREGGEA